MTTARMPRLLITAARFEAGLGGVARVARLTAAAAERLGFDPELVALLDAPGVTVGERPVRALGGRRWRALLAAQAAAVANRPMMFDAAGLARSAALTPLRSRYAVWMHGIEVWEGLRPSLAPALRRASLRIANSTHTLRRVEACHGGFGPASVCHLGTESDAPPLGPLGPAGRSTVLYVGRLDAAESYSKGAAELIACWPEVVASVPAARLVLVGGGSGLEAIQRSAATSPVSRAIEVAGFVPEGSMERRWAEADVFAMPSRGEGFGLVYVEAMRRGLPVIASIHDAGQEVNRHGKTGFNVQLDTPGDLPARIVELLLRPDLARDLGAAGHRLWRSEYSFSAFVARFEPLLRKLVEPAGYA